MASKVKLKKRVAERVLTHAIAYCDCMGDKDGSWLLSQVLAYYFTTGVK